MVRACVPRQAPGAELKVLSALNLTKIDLMGYYTKMRGLGYETDKRGLLVARSLAETINVDDEQDPIRELIELERRIPVKIGVDTSLRAKIIDSCGMTCVFCHNGAPLSLVHMTRIPPYLYQDIEEEEFLYLKIQMALISSLGR